MDGIEHRRLLDAVAPRRVNDPGVFVRIGGQPTIDRMVDALYDRFETDPLLRPLFGSDLSGEHANQKRFFAEWMGAGDQYSEAAYGTLKHRHDRLPITRDLAGRWLGHFRRALDASVPSETDRRIIFSHAQAMAFALVNEDHLVGRPTKKQYARAYQTERASAMARKGDLPGLRALWEQSPQTFHHPIKAAMIMQEATLAGRAEVVAWLLEAGIDADKPYWLPINLAGGAFERVLFVTPLCAARLKRRSNVEALLLEHGAKHDPFTAAFLGDVPRLEQQLASCPDWAQVSDPATDVLEITPLHHAVAGGRPAAVRTILSHVSERVRGSLRALRGAAAHGSLEMVNMLLDRGARAEGGARQVGTRRADRSSSRPKRRLGERAAQTLGPCELHRKPRAEGRSRFRARSVEVRRPRRRSLRRRDAAALRGQGRIPRHDEGAPRARRRCQRARRCWAHTAGMGGAGGQDRRS
jgi:truncated hemoglobin YjbI